MSYIPEYHENYYRVEGTAYNQGKIGIGTINPVQLLHVSGGNIRVDGTGFINGDLNVTGNLNVYGTSSQFAVSQVIAEDKAIELNVATGTPIGGGSYTTTAFTDDAGAEDGGLIVKSITLDSSRSVQDKQILYKTSSPASGWVSNLRWIVSGDYGKNTLLNSSNNNSVGFTIGTDGNNVNLYKNANNEWGTDDSLRIALDLTVTGNATINGNTTLGDSAADTVTINAGPVSLVNATAAADALEFGAGANLANLYRSANDTLRTDDSFIVGANLTILGSAQYGDSSADNITISGRLSKSVALISGNSTGSGAAVIPTADNNIITGASGDTASIVLPVWVSGREVEFRNRTAFNIRIHPTGSDNIFQNLALIPAGVGATPYITIASNNNRRFIAAKSGSTNIWFSDI